MDALVIANIEDATASSEFLKSQKAQIDEAYANYNSYLYEGEMKSNAYMSMKQRVPMVMEFYLTPEELYTVEMYINPQKMSFSHSKIINKQVTRGGIFFHHYGEDAPKLTIQGNTGLSGMRGIEQLEKIFNYSGTLLRYQNVGVNKINNGLPEPRQIISLEDTLNNFSLSNVIPNLTTGIMSTVNTITETAGQLLAQAQITIDTDNGLLSQAKAAEMVGVNLQLVANEIDWIDKYANLKSAIVKLNELVKDKKNSFKDIYNQTLDLVIKETSLKAPVVDNMAFQIAYQLYSDQVDEIDNSQSTNIDTTQLTIDMFKSKNQVSSDIAPVKTAAKESNLVNVYKCVKYSKLYQQPSVSSTAIGELSVGGEFTAFVDGSTEYWAKHVTNGYAMIKTPNNIKEVIKGDKPLELHMCVDPNKGYTKSNYAKDGNGSIYTVYPGGYFTYDKEQIVNGVTWFRHETTHFWVPSYVEGLGTVLQENTYLELVQSNCYIYTAIRDDIKMYTSPIISPENEVQENGKPKFLYKGGKFTAVQKQGEWLQHINDGYWCQLSTNGQPNFKEGFTNANTNIADGATVTGENHMPNILTSNNNITLEIEKTKTDCKTGYEQYLSDIRVWNKNSVIKRFEIENGFADIQDELTDEWLPRLVFLYFEDRVLIGHFDTFSYDRVAETENISYNMAFTIQRIISVTSISPTRFEQSSTLSNGDDSGTNNLGDYEESLEYFAAQYALGNDLPLKIEILRTKCKYYYENAIANYSGVAMTDERKNSILAHHQRLLQCSIYNGSQQLTENTPIYGTVTNTTYAEYINFMSLGYLYETDIYYVPTNELGISDTADTHIQNAQNILNLTTRIDGQLISPSNLHQDWCIAKYNDIILPELKRVNDIWTSESSMSYVDERRAAYELSDATNNIQLDSITFIGTNMTLGALIKQYGTIENIKKNEPQISAQLDKVIAEKGTELQMPLSLKSYTTSISNNRVRQLFEHAQNLILGIGARYANNSDFRQIYNNWLWQYNNYYGGSYPVQSTYKDKDAKITSTINSNDVYESTFKLTYNNKSYEFNVLNFSPTAKQNYAPVRYILETILKCECGWDNNKKRAICITNNNKILLDIETYLHTTIDEKTGKTSSTAYSPLSILLEYLNFNYKVTKEGGQATLRKEGITHISNEKTEIQLMETENTPIKSATQQTSKTPTKKEIEQENIEEELQTEKETKEKQNIKVTSDWDKVDKDEDNNEFKITNQDKKIIVKTGENIDIEFSGMIDGYILTSSIKTVKATNLNSKNYNTEIIKVGNKTFDTTWDKEKGIMTKRIYANAAGESKITFMRELKGKKKGEKTITIIVKSDLND